MPKTYGPANGFLKIICNIKPAIGKPIPAAIQLIVLGNLISLKIKLEKSKLQFSLPAYFKFKNTLAINTNTNKLKYVLLFLIN